MRWVPKTADPIQVERLTAELSGDPSLHLGERSVAGSLARLLVLRGITGAAAATHFLAPSLSDLHSPYLMGGVKPADQRIAAAIQHHDGARIHGH